MGHHVLQRGGHTLGSPRGSAAPCPTLPTPPRLAAPDRPRGWPSCLPICALALGTGYPTSAPPSPIGATHRHHHRPPPNKKER